MLHILLLLLKIIGIILLAVLGIVFLIILTLIFAPLRYELNGSSSGDLSSLNIQAKATFLVRIIRGYVQYQDKKLTWKLHLAWKLFSNQEIETNVSETEKDSETKKPVLSIGEDQAEHSISERISDPTPKEPITQAKTVENKQKNKTVSENSENKTENISSETKKGKTENSKKEKTGILKKIERLFQKLKCTFGKIYDMMISLKEKTDEITSFINDETHKSAFFKFLSELKRFLKKIKPKVLDGEISFGFEDPSITGRVLGGISMLYPYLQEHLDISADFEEKTLYGKLYIKGRIRLSMILSFLVHLFLDKTVRITIRHIKN